MGRSDRPNVKGSLDVRLKSDGPDQVGCSDRPNSDRSGSTALWLPVVPHGGTTACVRYGFSRDDVLGEFWISPGCGTTAVMGAVLPQCGCTGHNVAVVPFVLIVGHFGEMVLR